MNEVGFDKFLSAAGHARRRIPPNAARISKIFCAQPCNRPSLRSFLDPNEQSEETTIDTDRSRYISCSTPLLFLESIFLSDLKDR